MNDVQKASIALSLRLRRNNGDKDLAAVGIPGAKSSLRLFSGRQAESQFTKARALQLMKQSSQPARGREIASFGVRNLDVFGLAADEELNLESLEQDFSPAVTRVERRYVDRELFLNRFTSDQAEVMEYSQRIADGEDTEECRVGLRKAIRLARYRGEKALNAMERELTNEKMTMDDLKRRLSDLRKPSNLMTEIRAMVKESLEGQRTEETEEVLEDDLETMCLVDSDNHDTDVSEHRFPPFDGQGKPTFSTYYSPQRIIGADNEVLMLQRSTILNQVLELVKEILFSKRLARSSGCYSALASSG